MIKQKAISDVKEAITWLLENGDFKDTETSYNLAMNSINVMDEILEVMPSCVTLFGDKKKTREGNETRKEAFNKEVEQLVCSCMVFHKKDECYRLGCVVHREK